MPKYRVVWEIDIFDAQNPEDAARKALAIQRNPESDATVFYVASEDPDYTIEGEQIDLHAIDYPDGRLGTEDDDAIADATAALKEERRHGDPRRPSS